MDEVKADLYSMCGLLSKSIAQLHIGSIEQAVADFLYEFGAGCGPGSGALDYSISGYGSQNQLWAELRDESVVRFSQKLQGSALKIAEGICPFYLRLGALKQKLSVE